MFKNFVKIAWRNLLKNRVYASINILGLAFGMAVAMLIGLWLMDELTFNHYHTNHSDIAQVRATLDFNGQVSTQDAIAMPLAAELHNKYGSNFKGMSLASWNVGYILANGDKKISNDGMWVQPVFPSMMSLRMIEGNINALNDQLSALISQSTAKALFGDADPMNKTIRVNSKYDMKVAGVYEDIPHNSAFNDTHILMSWAKYITTEKWLQDAQQQWGNHSFQLFVQMNPNVNMDAVSAKIELIAANHFKEGHERIMLHSMDKWRLYSEFENGKIKGGRITYVWLFGIIGAFVLLLACINFMNLSTARSEKRAKEVGIRKAIGSVRKQLVVQFLSESVIMAVIAFVLALVLVLLFLPYFNIMADKQMEVPFANPWFWLTAIVFVTFTGVVSGSYPAFYLSGFNAVAVLKGTFRSGRFSALPRKILVVLQFTISVTLIIGTVIVFKQIQFAKNRPVGYTREGLITVMMNTPDLVGHYDAIRNDLIRTGAVENMAESSSPTTGVWSNQIGFDWTGKDPSVTPVLGTIAVTHDFGKTIGWHVIQGRDFSKAFATDTNAMLINEKALKLIGFKNPVGQTVKLNGKAYTVVGVVSDMIMDSPYVPVDPTVFMMNYGWANVITIKIKPTVAVSAALDKIGGVFKRYNPGSPFTYKFTDDEYAQKFSDEERIGKLASFFAVLAIFISSLGLFGLASFVAEQRTKEIGVRKVLGASVANLWGMLSKEFILLVMISCLIATPLAWYYLNNWLKAYHYRTEISWWVFIVSCAGAMLITLMTVSAQAIKAAVANPVKSLRSE
ncbi:ABC-type antimicrobial peptide transport system, permease component [Mucilaginibacter mallensis]|uniref:ABC-type antimicrobial peptide transport system, permease component n=1 Tax=Mucilaginibacter mallensis TaxID=652787 RepID=A0A1H2AV82_MUCMA|nr:ABC transporter permease [Mucilaginibacter mallensis]SDT49888.1 ABC-type antimicrobial peptide transport system, permease component [Mucilaginibacter mallensis]